MPRRGAALLLSAAAAGALGAAQALPHDPFYTHFHPQALKNWENDPNGPMYFNGRYHLFFQWNPVCSGTQGKCKHAHINWYHMVSKDLVHWSHLPVALAPDQGYDCGGIYSGSATIFHNATTGTDVPVLSYSVACGQSIVNAFPADVTDVNLTNWTKPAYNPVIPVPPSVTGGFRDPTTAWQGKDKTWRMLVGCGGGVGACQFKSKDFISWAYVGAFHSPGGTAMWECPDFYNVPGTDKWVLKASASGDWWALGTYTEVSDDTKPDSFAPVSGDIHDDNQKYDFGTFYASKVFHDPVKDRAVLFGWVRYNCPGTDWTGIQTFPRTVSVDPANATRIVTNPIDEIASLRQKKWAGSAITIPPGGKYTLPLGGAQLDVQLSVAANFSRQNGFSVTTLASSDGTKGQTVKVQTAAAPEPRPAAGWVSGVNPQHASLDGQPFLVAEPSLSLRLLVDHSVVEAYAQGGRAVATHHYCPASPADTGVQVANSGPDPIVVAATVWQLATANVIPNP